MNAVWILTVIALLISIGFSIATIVTLARMRRTQRRTHEMLLMRAARRR